MIAGFIILGIIFIVGFILMANAQMEMHDNILDANELSESRDEELYQALKALENKLDEHIKKKEE